MQLHLTQQMRLPLTTPFTDIPIIIESVLEQTSGQEALTIEHILALDEVSRAMAIEKIGKSKRLS